MYTHQIRKAINDALTLIKEFQKADVKPDTLIGFNRITPLIQLLGTLSNLLIDKRPHISSLLKSYSSRLIVTTYPQGVFMNAYVFGRVMNTIDILDKMYYDSPKFFISHSSKDEAIVKAFVEKILLLGCRFSKEDIYCTLDTSAIPIGVDFRNDIIVNMRKCDYIVLMISENYRTSEICHNEVGAAWALQDSKRVLPFKFPNMNFNQDDLGVLMVVKQAASLTDRTQLMSLYEEWCSTYNIKPQIVTFSKYVDEFIEIIRETNNKL
jgi:hypothetical protein